MNLWLNAFCASAFQALHVIVFILLNLFSKTSFYGFLQCTELLTESREKINAAQLELAAMKGVYDCEAVLSATLL